MTETNIPTPLEARIAEVAEYEAAIELYTAISASLPGEWPTHLLDYRGSTDKHAAIATVDSMEDVELLSDLWAKDDAEAAIRANVVEMRKAQAILNVLQA